MHRLSADDIANTMGIHSGTTAVACLLRENQLIVANAGDSRCILSCKGKCSSTRGGGGGVL